MRTSEKLGWCAVVLLVVIALSMAFSAVVSAEQTPPPSIVEQLVAVQPSLATHKGEPVDAREFAEVLNATCVGNRQWCALLLTIAVHESALDSRIARSDCGAHECDNGLAWGLFQVHKTARNASVWGSPDLSAQAKEASHLARQAYNLCRNSGVPFPLSTLRAYAGHGCTGVLKGEDARVRTFNRIVRKL